MVGRSSILRLLLLPLGHTSTTTEADTLQIWPGKAVKAHHSENNLTLLLKRENTDSPSYIPPGRALQVKLQIYSMREEFIFFLPPRSSLLKLAPFVGFIAPIPIDRVYTKLLVCCEAIRYAVRWRYEEDVTRAIDFFIQLMAFHCFPIWRQNEYTKDLRKQLNEIRYEGAFASLRQYKVRWDCPAGSCFFCLLHVHS